MLMRRIALPIAGLTALATVPVLASVAPAGASSAIAKPAPESRGGDNGGSGDPKGPGKQNEQPPNNCPTQMWTVPLEIKGLACILLLPKPEKQGQNGESGGQSGLGGLLG